MTTLSKPPGRLSDNVLFFARALRRAGLPIGPGSTIEALEALSIAGLENREDVRAALRAVLVKKHEHAAVFEHLFAFFWRRRGFQEQLMALLAPRLEQTERPTPPPQPAAARARQALFPDLLDHAPPPTLEPDARLTSSEIEVLRTKDFAQMSAAEIDQARKLIAGLRLTSDEAPSRRWRQDPRGPAIDSRATLRRQLRSGGASIDLVRRAKRLRTPPIVALCDISGSMSEYTRLLLHFLHALTERRKATQTFLFGTRLTNVTRALRARDVDEALAKTAQEASDWSGGTRISSSLHAFNRDWSRRVLSQGATVLLFTDGLERDPGADLAAEMRRLHASCRRLIWLNPLLRYEGFEPKALGVRAMLPHVDAFLSIHNLKTMQELCAALDRPRDEYESAFRRLRRFSSQAQVMRHLVAK